MHSTACARCFALVKTGSNNDARIPMIAITTSNSINVKPAGELFLANLALARRLFLLFSIFIVIAGPVAGAGNDTSLLLDLDPVIALLSAHGFVDAMNRPIARDGAS